MDLLSHLPSLAAQFSLIAMVPFAPMALLILLMTSLLHADLVTSPQRAFGYGEVARAVVSPDGSFLATSGQSGAFLWHYPQRTVQHRLEAHHTIVMGLAFSPDSSRLITGGRDGVIREWDTATGRPLRERLGHAGEINALVYSPDGSMIASASGDHSAKIWAATSGKVLHSLVVTGEWINAVAFSPDGTLLATSDSAITNNLRIWNVTSGQLERSLGSHIGQVWVIRFLPDGRLASAGDDGKVRIWNAHSGVLARTLQGGSSLVNGLAVSSNSVVAGFYSGSIMAWDVDTGSVTKNITSAPLWHLEDGPAIDRVIAVYSDLVVREWNLATETVATEFEGHTTSTILGLAFTPDGTKVISGGSESKVRIWNRSNAAPEKVIVSSPGGTASTVISPDGAGLLTTAGTPAPRMQLWNLETGEWQRDFSWPSGWPVAAAWSADGTRVAAGTMANEVHLFNVSTGARTTLSGHASAVRSVAFSPDGSLLASGDAAGAVRIWNASSGQWMRTLAINSGWVNAVAFSPATNELMTASEDGFLHFWNPATGGFLRSISVTGGFLEAAAYSPNGRFVVSGAGWPFLIAELWNVQTGELLRAFGGHSGPVHSVAFSPDGLAVLTGSDVVRLWDLSALLGRLHARPIAGGVELRWDQGTLQRSPAVLGPWSDVPAAASPWIQSASAPGEYFRLKLRD